MKHYCSLATSTRVTRVHLTRVVRVHATLPVSCTVDCLIAMNSLSLATFPLFITLPYTGKAAKLKLFIAISESTYIALLSIKFVWHL